jgi:LmbE family N-acetylglucosaminyl deacetylase
MPAPQSNHTTRSGTEELTIVAVYAHPDDGEFFAGGTLAKWVTQGHRVYAICCSDGSLGSKRVGIAPVDVAAARASELSSAMKALGAEPPILLGYPDGSLRAHSDAVYERLVYWLRKLRADRVVTFDPWKKYEIHPDHIEVGKRASEAAVFSCFPNLFHNHAIEGLEAVQPREVWYMGPTEHRPNRVVDIEATLETKINALLCHQSQVEMLANWFVPGADPRNLTEPQKELLREGAANFLKNMAEFGARFSGKIRYGEAFYVLRCGPGHFDNYDVMFREALGEQADVEVE